MHRYRLLVEYDGRPFVGWQRQDNGPSVQQAIEEAALALTGQQAVSAVAAGRTDSGVHALAMVAHIDLEKQYADDKVRDALNFYLKPAPIAILDAERVDEHFHARFNATARHYLYRIIARRAPLALDAGRAWWLPGPLDHEAMHRAAQCLVGKHDFSTFRAAQCQAKSPVKTLRYIDVMRRGDEVEVAIGAPSFLHHQVRSITGSLVQVGIGRWDENRMAEILQAASRAACGPVAPACGLYFLRADYEAAN